MGRIRTMRYRKTTITIEMKLAGDKEKIAVRQRSIGAEREMGVGVEGGGWKGHANANNDDIG